MGSRLAIGLAIGLLGYAAIVQRDYLKTHFRHLAVFVFAVLITAAPVIFVFSRHIDEFLGRVNATGLFANDRLAQISAAANMQPLDFLLRQIQVSTTVIIATPAWDNFFDSRQPYLVWWTSVFLIFGMAYALRYFKQVRYMMLLGCFWAPLILGSAFTTSAPNPHRMLGAAPALVLLVTIGLWKFTQAIQLIFPRVSKRWLFACCALIVALTALRDIHFYFVGEFRTNHYFEDASNEFSYEVGKRAGELGPNYRLFLLGAPKVFSSFADFHYFAPLTDVEDFNIANKETIMILPRDRGIFFAAIPSKIDDLKFIEQQLPGGKWMEVPRTTQEGISYYAYILPYISVSSAP